MADLDQIDISEYEATGNRFLQQCRRPSRFLASDDAAVPLLADALNSLRSSLSLMPRRERMGYIHVGLSDDLLLNACTFHTEGKDFIVFNVGTVFLVIDMFHRMLSHPGVLPRVGNIADERPSIIPLPGVVTDANLLASIGSYGLPIDHKRQALAGYFTSVALTFLNAHEYGHLLYGHVGYMNAQTGQPFISEMISASGSGGPILTRQIIEVDADSCATVQGIAALGQFFDKFPDPVHHEFKDTIGDWETALFNWCFAVTTLFCMFGAHETDVSQIDQHLYPPPYFRAWWIMSTGFHWMEKYRGKEHAIRCSEIFANAFAAVRDALNCVTNGQIDLSGFGLLRTPALEAHMKRLRLHWNDVRPLLEPYARGTLAPLYVPDPDQ